MVLVKLFSCSGAWQFFYVFVCCIRCTLLGAFDAANKPVKNVTHTRERKILPTKP
jgi:hypothetical protein